MKGISNWKFTAALACLLTLLAVGLFSPGMHSQAQSGTNLVQQTAQMLNVATKFCTTTATINVQVTCTMTPSGSNYVYITAIDLMACNSNSASTAIANATFTSTNISGSPVWQLSLATTANLCAPPHTVALTTPLKSATPGTAVTLVSPAGVSQTAFTITAAWYEAP